MKLKIILAAGTLIVYLPANASLASLNADNNYLINNSHISQANQTELLWLKHSNEINRLIQEAINYQNNQNYPSAIASLQKAEQIAQKDAYILGQWQALSFQALTYKQMGEFEKSIALNQQNIEFLHKQTQQAIKEQFVDIAGLEAQSLDAISNNYTFSENYAKAIEILKKALNLLEQRENKVLSSVDIVAPKLLMKLGVNLFLAGNLPESEKTLFAAWEDYENKINTRIKAGSSGLYEYEFVVEVLRWLPQVLVAQNKTNQALELAELGRARAFSALLKNRLDKEGSFQPNPEKLSIEQIKKIAKAQNSTLVQYTLTYDFNPDLFLPFSNLQKNSASGLLIWVVKPTGEIAFRQVKIDKNKPFLTVVQNARKAINIRSSNNKKKDLQNLYKLLIAPVADLLPTNPESRVTFIPQDLLFLVPFAALQDTNSKYLIEKHTILTAPAFKVLDLTYHQQQQITNAVKGVLVVGNPTMPSYSAVEGSPPEQLASLPGAETEAIAIAQLFQTQAITGNQATKANIIPRMSQARIIHLATHGILDDVGGVFSSLAFAPSAQDTGFLTTREIISQKLKAELVVLSACNTGRGKITGDGVVGLSRAFIAAGVPSVIVSLWSIPDAPSATLMTEFYQTLKNNADKAQALRQAMLTTMKQYPDPIDWAAFTLIGSGDASAIKTASGDVSISASNNTQAGQSSYYTAFPVPNYIKNYTEFPSQSVQGEIVITFNTNLSFDEIVKFYRQAFSVKNFTEDPALTQLTDPLWQQIVFNDSPNGKKIAIQMTQDSYNNARNVSVRLEK
ncbi:MAG TPA: CHAT domain-containing tetratricopeptide repeat protein [Oculatellaceae cyanobacterium]|jgi:CHAT domain-containing protein